jgi:hypothetical protein
LAGKQARAQSALDMLVAYGVAILVIAVTIYIILQLGIFNNRLAQNYCNSAPSFICDQMAINTTGVVTIIFTQGTGGTMNITGISCASLANNTFYGPEYGNFYTWPYGKAAYPSNQLQNGLIVYSSNQTKITFYCYGPGGIAKGQLGNTFSGFVWLNYTYTNLPANYHVVQQVFSFTAKYT